MMIMLRNTDIAYAAMLTSSWLGESTCAAKHSGFVQDIIVRIITHISHVVLVSDD